MWSILLYCASTPRPRRRRLRAAERRKQKVFLSYASENANVAAALANKLKQRFEVVFDYRDGESLVADQVIPLNSTTVWNALRSAFPFYPTVFE